MMGIDKKNTNAKFYPIGRWQIGEKSGEPKSGEKILFLDAKYVDFKQSPNVIQVKFWHAVFGIVFLLMRYLHIRICGLFDGHKVALQDSQNMAIR